MVFTNIKNKIISRKKLLAFGMLAIVLGGIVSPIKAVAQSCTGNQIVVNGRCVDPFAAPTTNPCTGTQVFQGGRCVERSELNGPRPTSAGDLASNAGGVFSDFIVAPLFQAIGRVLMTISAGILALVGMFFDFVVTKSIIQMGTHLGNQESLGGSISSAWRVLRDIANMFFIFVLLYVAFKAILDLNFGNVGKSIANIIIVALLINFSLFFSKVIIDASNIVAIGFYNSIVTANTQTVTGGGTEAQTATAGNQTISSGYMRLLGLQEWYDAKVLVDPKNMTPDRILIIGIMASVFMLITAVVLLISAIMFAARFIILMFIMILSPLAFVAFIIPGQEKYSRDWWSALVNQSIFAPVFFALTWVTFKIAKTPNFLGQSVLGGTNSAKFIDVGTSAPNPDSLALVFNYVIVIGFAIAALVIAKKIATSTAYFTAISGGIGAGAIGGAAILGRQTIGRGAKMLAESSKLRDAASAGKWYSGAARAGLWTADKGAGGSFDLRATDTLKKVPGLGKELDLLGKAGGKGGFAKAVEQKADDKAKYAKRVYGQTTAETEKANELGEKYKKDRAADEERVKTERQTNLEAKRRVHEGDKTARDEYMAGKTRTQSEALRIAEESYDNKKKEVEDKLNTKKEEHERIKKFGSSWDISKSERELRDQEKEAEEELRKADESRKAAQQALNTEKQRIESEDTDYQSLHQRARGSKQELDLASERAAKKEIDRSEYSQEVRDLEDEWKAKKEAGKKRMLEFADRVEKGSPVSTMVGGLAGGALGAIFGGPIGTVIGAGAGAGGGNWTGGKLPKRANWAGNTEAGRKIRAAAEGRDKKDPKKLKKEIDDLFGIKNEEGDGQSGDEGNKKEGGEDKDKKKES